MRYSIIVPFYNASQFLRETLNSIYKQNMNDYEVIIIDDGSDVQEKEKLLKITEGLNCKIITHSNNKGLGEARNTGIDNANGEFVVLLDSDDYLSDANILSKINNVIEMNNSPDLIKTNTRILDQTNPSKPAIYNEISNVLFAEKPIAFELYFKSLSSWQFIYRKKYLIDNEIKFKLPRFEDRPFIYEALSKTMNIVSADEIMTIYRKRPPNSENKSILQKKRSKEDLYLYLDNCKYSKDIVESYSVGLRKYVFTNSFCTLCDSYHHLINDFDDDIVNLIKEKLGNDFHDLDCSSTTFQIYGAQRYKAIINKIYG